MGENVRLIYDLINFCESNNIRGMLLQIDFEKAFDSLSWEFVYKVLDAFNFKDSFKRWINIFYKNPVSYVMLNGTMSRPFGPQRGCRQGDPLSPYIFILCSEILTLLVKENRRIKGIHIGDTEFLISQYADDTVFVLDGSPSSFTATMFLLEQYAEMSGLHVNYLKTNVIWIGSRKFSSLVFHRSRWKLKWGQSKIYTTGF